MSRLPAHSDHTDRVVTIDMLTYVVTNRKFIKIVYQYNLKFNIHINIE